MFEVPPPYGSRGAESEAVGSLPKLREARHCCFALPLRLFQAIVHSFQILLSYSYLVLMSFRILAKSFGSSIRLILATARLAVVMDAMRMPPTSAVCLLSGTTKTEKKFQKLKYLSVDLPAWS